jgi:purine-binding chemotaxis protein CheW
MSGSFDDTHGTTSEGRDWAQMARSATREEQAEPEVLRELLSFQLAGSPYAIPVERVREIVRLRQITPVPRVPAAVLGVIELRGEIVQVIDLRMRLDLPSGELTRKSRIVVLHADDERVSGVFVDGVDEVLRAPEDEIRPATAGAGFVCEICVRGSDFVSIIDVDRALDLYAD